MCLIFIYDGTNDPDSDYRLILAANRDEYYNRPSTVAAPWEDRDIIGGRDLKSGTAGGSWLAISPSRRKIGVLLNNPDKTAANPKSRGKVVEDYMRDETSIEDYIAQNKKDFNETNGFILVSVTMEPECNVLTTYNNMTDQLQTWQGTCNGFGNSIPDRPLTKIYAGKSEFLKICQRNKKGECEGKLVEELTKLLKWDESHLPDPQLEKRNPNVYKALSSVFVQSPVNGYGTRTHTLILVKKNGEIKFIEKTMQEPIDINNIKWSTIEYDLKL